MVPVLHALEPFARPVVAVLLNGLWQGVLIAFAVWAILKLFPRANASTRYAAWTAALLAIIVLPIVTSLPRISAPPPSPAVLQTASNIHTQWFERHIQPNTTPVRPSRPLSEPAQPPQPIGAPQPLQVPRLPQLSVPSFAAVVLFALWGVFALGILVRIALGLYQLEMLKRDALPLRIEHRDTMDRWSGAAKGSREVRLCVSDQIEVPVAVGLFDAMIVLPKHLLERLDGGEIDQISLHELAHLRRADDWTNGLQRIAQALLFFNPAVQFVARQMDLEREVACDDWVLGLTGAVRPYAFCLTKMAEVTAWPHRPLAAPGVFASRRHISIRIERLLAARRAIGSALAPGASLAVVGGLGVLAIVLLAVTPGVAYTSATHDSSVGAVVTKPHRTNASAPPHTAKPANPRRERPQPTERPPAAIPGGPTQVAYVKKNAAPTRELAPPPAPHAPSLPRAAAVSHLHAKTAPLAAGALGLATGVTASAAATAHAEGLAVAAQTLGALKDASDPSKSWNCSGCNFSGANLAGHDFSGQSLVGDDFSNANLRGANFRNAKLSGTDFNKADLSNASFAGANMTGCDLSGANLTGTDFRGAKLTGCDVDVAALSPSQAEMILRMCTGCDFSKANLRGRDLRGIELTGVDLSGADLRDSDLSNAKFSGVDLSGAKLQGAKLDNARFIGCDFSGTDLRGVDLSRAVMTGSSLGDAILR